MSLSDETKETVATIDREVFGNENPDCNFIRILLHNFYDQQCLMCRELSSEEGADYEAFILALDLWNSVNEERDKIKKFIDALCNWTDDGWLEYPPAVHALLEICWIRGHLSISREMVILRGCDEIRRHTSSGMRDDAFVRAKELLDFFADIPSFDDDGVARNISDCYDYFDEGELFHHIKRKKQRWMGDENQRLHLMARYFEVNMMYAKLYNRQGHIGGLLLAGIKCESETSDNALLLEVAQRAKHNLDE